jgi:uracil-DNA glycosylase
MGTDTALVRLHQIRESVASCTACVLHETRKLTVFDSGSHAAKLMIVGEGPGADEDRKGEPFVGDAGRVLNEMLASIRLTRADVYVANVVKCRPPENRKPKPDEVKACRGYLEEQIELVRPKVILALGATAVSTLLRTKTGITQLRGKWQEYKGTSVSAGYLRVDVMPTFHPAYLLRVPEGKHEVWQDMKAVAEKLGHSTSKGAQ